MRIKYKEEIKEADRGLIGTKASNLWRLYKLGYNVPDFLVILDYNLKDNIKIRLNPPFAVRSTFPHEDLAESSQAGKYESFLNVSERDLLKAVHKCHCSYKDHKKNFPVLVQEMIQPDYSGVSFSINPVTGERKKIIIELVKGLSDKLLSGKSSGFHYEVVYNSKSDVHLISKTGSSDYPELIQLAKITKDVESHFNHPVDIEWAVKNNVIYLLQARPITGHVPLEFDLSHLTGFHKKISWFWNSRHVGREPMSPLACSVIRICDKKKGFTRQAIFNGYHYTGDDMRTRPSGNITSKMWYEKEEKKWLDVLKELRMKDLSVISDKELLKELEKRLNICASFSNLAFNGWKLIDDEDIDKLKKAISRAGLAEIKNYEDLTSFVNLCLPSINHKQEEEMFMLKDPKYFSEHFSEFLFDYGDFLMHNFDIGKPNFGENIEEIKRAIELLNKDMIVSYEKQKKTKEELIEKLINQSLNPSETRKLIDEFELFCLRREDDDYYLLCLEGQLRRACKEIGKRAGIGEDVFYLGMDSLKKIFQLSASEIKNQIKANKELYSKFEKMNPPPRIFGGIADYKYKLLNLEKNVFEGMPVCKGHVKGHVKIITKEENLTGVNKGDILVCETFMPSMTYVIPRLKGLITQYGIMNSHGAIVAREYGIPAVFCVADITLKLKDGQKILLDGSRGIVKILS